MSNRRFSIGFLSLFCGVLFLLTSCREKADPLKTLQLGADPVEVSKTAGEGRILLDWARKGYRGMTLVHVGGHAGLAPVSDETVKELGRRMQSKDWDALEIPAGQGRQGLVSNADYLSAAIGLGIVREIYWAIPYPFFGSAGGGEQARQFLVDRRLVKDRAEADRFRMAGGCLAGSLRNVEITICAPDTMHLVQRPVLLEIDADFFPAYARGRGVNLLEGFKLFMDAIFSRRYTVAEAYITPYPAGDSFDPALAYVGSQVQEAFKKPSIMQQPDPPPLWKARDDAEALLRQLDFRQAYTASKASIREFGPDEGLLAMLACAALQLGKHEEAMTIGGELCRKDSGLCNLLLYIGDHENGRGRQDRAEAFFRKALEIMPGWEPAKRRLADSQRPKQVKE